MNRMINMIGVTAWAVLVLAGTASAAKGVAEVTVVRYLAPENAGDTRMMYYVEVLKLALEKTADTHGAFKMEPAPRSMTQVEAMKYLMAGEQLDVLHSMTDRGRERVLRPVRIPLDKGLSGIRLLLINKDDESKFAAITNLQQLGKISLGQGSDWPDTEILKSNQLKVTPSITYPALFEMLKSRQIDAFPRAVFEIFEELDQHKADGFSVAPGLFITYPAAMYFFVRQSNLALAERLETGLRRAIADGSFDALFSRYLKADLDKAALPTRIKIQLKNASLPENTPLNDRQLWHL